MNYPIEAAKQALESIDLDKLKAISRDVPYSYQVCIQDTIADIKAAKKFLSEAETK